MKNYNPKEILEAIAPFTEDVISKLMTLGTKHEKYKWWYCAFTYYINDSGEIVTMFEPESYKKVYDYLVAHN